jgi:hypothetical protein
MTLHSRDRLHYAVQGHVGLWTRDERSGICLPRCSRHNQIQDQWMNIMAQMLMGQNNFRIQAMYLEFENVADPDDPVTVPTFDESEGTDYYEELAFSSTRDFLRVPLTQKPLLGIETGYENSFVAGASGNKLTYFSMSQGTQGVHGKPYSDAANSKVFGLALVATPLFSDRTQDLVFARTYFGVSEQVVKEASHQIGATWDIVFLRPS